MSDTTITTPAASLPWRFVGTGNIAITSIESTLRLRRNPPLSPAKAEALIPERQKAIDRFLADPRVAQFHVMRDDLAAEEAAVADLAARVQQVEATDRTDPFANLDNQIENMVEQSELRDNYEAAVARRDSLRATVQRMFDVLSREQAAAQEKLQADVFTSGMAAVRAAQDEIAAVLSPILDRVAAARARIDRAKISLPIIDKLIGTIPPSAAAQPQSPVPDMLHGQRLESRGPLQPV